MTYRARLIATISVAAITAVCVLKRPIAAQGGTPSAGAFTLEQVLDYPFPANLVAAPEELGGRVDVQRAQRAKHLLG